MSVRYLLLIYPKSTLESQLFYQIQLKTIGKEGKKPLKGCIFYVVCYKILFVMLCECQSVTRGIVLYYISHSSLGFCFISLFDNDNVVMFFPVQQNMASVIFLYALCSIFRYTRDLRSTFCSTHSLSFLDKSMLLLFRTQSLKHHFC